MINNGTHILTINSGSTSLKFSLFNSEPFLKIFDGTIDRIGMEGTTIKYTDLQTGTHNKELVTTNDTLTLLYTVLEKQFTCNPIGAIAHRIVHGATTYQDTTLINETVIEELKKLIPLAPRHLPAQVAVLESFLKKFANIPQYACFDTEFFKELPRMAQMIALPRKYETMGVRRYGFHGLSYEYITHYLQNNLNVDLRDKKIILAHLGSGTSLTGLIHGKPVEVSMGFSPASGVPMSTRSGDLDPGLFEYFSNTLHFTATEFSHLINFESGLLGISELTSDMKILLEVQVENIQAKEAVDFYCYQLKKYIGGLTAVMGGVDIIVFTGGIGEASAEIRHKIIHGLDYLGIVIDELANTANSLQISTHDSRVILYRIPTDEGYMMIKHVKTMMP